MSQVLRSVLFNFDSRIFFFLLFFFFSALRLSVSFIRSLVILRGRFLTGLLTSVCSLDHCVLLVISILSLLLFPAFTVAGRKTITLTPRVWLHGCLIYLLWSDPLWLICEWSKLNIFIYWQFSLSSIRVQSNCGRLFWKKVGAPRMSPSTRQPFVTCDFVSAPHAVLGKTIPMVGFFSLHGVRSR